MKENKSPTPSFGVSLGLVLGLVVLLVAGFGWQRMTIQPLLFIAIFCIGTVSVLLGF